MPYDPIELLAMALVDHRDNHPDDDERTIRVWDERTIRVWFDESALAPECLYHKFSEQQITKLAEYIRAGQPKAEQPQDARDGDGAAHEAADAVRVFLDAWEAERGPGSIRGGNADMPYLFSSDLRAVLAEREQLVARVAELEAELRELLFADGSVDLYGDTADGGAAHD